MTSTALLMLSVDVWAAAESVEPPRSWWPWLAGLVPGALVVGALVLALRWVRGCRAASSEGAARPSQ